MAKSEHPRLEFKEAIAAELIASIRRSVTIDLTLLESARSKIRVTIKRILNRYGYALAARSRSFSYN
jgi:hypothetical protein